MLSSDRDGEKERKLQPLGVVQEKLRLPSKCGMANMLLDDAQAAAQLCFGLKSNTALGWLHEPSLDRPELT